jgi:hypothetical protein
VSSLVFHQVPLLEKRNGVAAMFASVRTGGEIHIADYAYQRSRIMRSLFRLTVQMLDGTADTQLNADGALEGIITDQTGAEVLPRSVMRTATGAISIFSVTKTLDP